MGSTVFSSSSASCPLLAPPASRLTATFSTLRSPRSLGSTPRLSPTASVRSASFQNLSGAVSWMHLRNITTLQTLDLSGNALEGSIPGAFWSAPALIEVNLAENHLGGPLRFDGSSLRFLNLSSNRFTGAPDLSRLSRLRVLDLSGNQLGEFPGDFPAVDELRFLNVSLNNLTGVASLDFLQKFGSAAFVEAGVLTDESPPTKNKKRAGGGYGDFGSAVALTLYYARRRCGTRKGRTEEKDVEATAEVGWVAAARWGAAVVIFEKPLMELTFADLAAATSGFGRESLMAEAGRNGPVYRAVLPGDMHVVVRVLESARPVEEKEAAAAFRDIARLRHPNLLPLLGYCISGSEKLLLRIYGARRSPPMASRVAGGPPKHRRLSIVETWENNPANTRSTTTASGDWPTRHRIALGGPEALPFFTRAGWAPAPQSSTATLSHPTSSSATTSSPASRTSR
ncbi:hypothetical protein HPP92_020035 [Vanilla planifolia]|uniref:Protein kinase domain-containing protein n=1 Tax=Vanilla planifolia TaxID=51239 RepID=A0A835Q4E3_VANPL|nr:hypothetical protein HPP92_020035 [Vanilla planifolia]